MCCVAHFTQIAILISVRKSLHIIGGQPIKLKDKHQHSIVHFHPKVQLFACWYCSTLSCTTEYTFKVSISWTNRNSLHLYVAMNKMNEIMGAKSVLRQRINVCFTPIWSFTSFVTDLSYTKNFSESK